MLYWLFPNKLRNNAVYLSGARMWSVIINIWQETIECEKNGLIPREEGNFCNVTAQFLGIFVVRNSSYQYFISGIITAWLSRSRSRVDWIWIHVLEQVTEDPDRHWPPIGIIPNRRRSPIGGYPRPDYPDRGRSRLGLTPIKGRSWPRSGSGLPPLGISIKPFYMHNLYSCLLSLFQFVSHYFGILSCRDHHNVAASKWTSAHGLTCGRFWYSLLGEYYCHHLCSDSCRRDFDLVPLICRLWNALSTSGSSVHVYRFSTIFATDRVWFGCMSMYSNWKWQLLLCESCFAKALELPLEAFLCPDFAQP